MTGNTTDSIELHNDNIEKDGENTETRDRLLNENERNILKQTEHFEEDIKRSLENRNFTWKIKNDRVYRHKFTRTVFMWWASIVFGWTTGQIGPSLLDLQFITGSTLEKASAFLTSGSVGYLFGSMLSGFFHSKMSGDLLLFLCISGNVVMTVIVPWCFLYEVMVAAMLIRHIFFGAYDTVINAGMMQTWHQQSKFYMQVLHLSFAIGGILSPLATAPFLIKLNNKHNVSESFNVAESNLTMVSYSDITTHEPIYSDDFFVQNSTVTEYSLHESRNTGTDDYDFQGESKIFIAYSITAGLLLSAAIPFLALSARSRPKANNEVRHPMKEKRENEIKYTKFTVLIIWMSLALLTCFDVAIEKGTHEFLTTFCVRQSNWSKNDSSYVNSAFWAAYAFCRFCGIFLIQILSPAKMIICHMVLLILSYIGLLISATFYFDEGVWLFLPISGFAMSVIFPTLFTWTEINLLPVTGGIASLFVVSGSLGSIVNPLAIGSLMDNVTPMYFCYLLLGESVFLFVIYIMASVLSKKISK